MSDAPNRPLMPDEAPDWFVAELAQAMYALGDHLHEWSEAGLDLRGGYLLEARQAVTAAMNLATSTPAASGGADQEGATLAELRRLSDAATPGPWRQGAQTPWGSQVIFNESGEMFVGVNAHTAPPGDGWSPAAKERAVELGRRKCADVQLILAAVNYVRSRLAPSTDPAPEPGPERWATTKFDPKLILPKPWADDEIDPAKRGPWASVSCGTADLAATVAGLLNAAEIEPALEDGGA